MIRISRLLIATFSASALSLMGCGQAPIDEAMLAEPIINGTVPALGELASYGVVELARGCTGTLLTNQHVLTAHHCTGRWNGDAEDWSGTLNAPGTMRVTLETDSGNLTATNSTIFEPPCNVSTWTLNGGPTGDFAIIELDQPIAVSGAPDMFWNKISSQEDSDLVGRSVLCMGYGATSEATATTLASGFRTLTYANMTIASISNGSFKRNRTNDVVGFGGDSGSTCFLSGLVTGVQSTCSGFSYYDVNGNGIDDGWEERYNTQSCTSSTPGSLRTWAEGIYQANVNLAYRFLPALGGALTARARIYVVGTEIASSPANVGTTLATFGQSPRSGRVTVKVSKADAPSHMMCPNVIGTTPLRGDFQSQPTCFGDGLVSAIVD